MSILVRLRRGVALARAALLFPWIASALTACGEPDDPAWRIAKTRVLGARAEADADRTRASIRPGEAFRVAWFVVGPDGETEAPYRLGLCRSAELVRDVDCDGPNFVEVSGRTGAPSMFASAPELGALNGATHLLVKGFVGDRDVVLSIPIERAEADANRHPDLPPDAVRFDGEPWPEAGTGCGSSSPEIAADDAEHTIRVLVPDAAREALPDGLRETLQLSHFTTAGELDRQFSVVEAEAPAGDAALDVSFVAKRGHATPDGRTVHVYLALRDSRGGMSFTKRALCMRQIP